MIIDFTVSNYLSIKEEITLSFISDNKNVMDNLKTIPIENDKYHVHAFSAIFGPNASGKTNIIKAFSDLMDLVSYSNVLNLDDSIPSYKPHRLDKKYINAPTTFEIEFVAEGLRYNFYVKFDSTTIISETLVFFPEGKKALLYSRDENLEIKYGTYFTGMKKALETNLLPNRLFLSVASNSKNDILKPVYRYFKNVVDIHVRMDSSNTLFHSTTRNLRVDEEIYKPKLLKLLQAADFSIEDISLVEKDSKFDLNIPKEFPEDLKKQIVEDLSIEPYLGHRVYNEGNKTNEIVNFHLHSEESAGTIKMYDLSGEVIDALEQGSVLVVDEFNGGLHPLLSNFIVELFLNPLINKKNAQLLISSHDTSILDIGYLKREQFWFTDKRSDGSTELYSLDEFDKNLIRDNAKYGKHYLDGRFKGLPTTRLVELCEGLFNA